MITYVTNSNGDLVNLAAVGERLSASRSWTPKDCAMYAISVGAGESESSSDLPYLVGSADHPLEVLPGFVCICGLHTEIELKVYPRTSGSTLMAGDDIRLIRPIPDSGTMALNSTVTKIYDQGSGALVQYSTQGDLAETNERVFERTWTVFVRGSGGFDGQKAQRPATTPTRPPDLTTAVPLIRTSALIYRMLEGHDGRVHWDFEEAQRAGFPRPIMYGRASFGAAVLSLMRVAGIASDDVRRLACTYRAVAFPGEVLKLEAWCSEDSPPRYEFRVLNQQGDRVIDGGRLELRGDASPGEG